MKISQNKSNNLLKKLYVNSFITNKKENSNNRNLKNKLENNNKKSITLSTFLKNSNSTHRNIKKYDLKEKSNTLRESYEIKNKINHCILKSNENMINKNNKKRNVLNKKNNINKNEIGNKIILNNNAIKVNTKNNLDNNTVDNIKNKNIVAVCHNKTINHIRIKNPKLNSVLHNHYEYKNLKNKPINFYLQIRNFNSLNKKNNSKKNINKNNNSFREKNLSNKYFNASKLKIKLKKNRSIEKEYLNFYKVDKKFYNKNINNKHNLNRTIIQNYFYSNNKEDIKNESENEMNNKLNTISCNNDISLIDKENNNAQNIKNSNIDIFKLKLDKIRNNMRNGLMTERENKNISYMKKKVKAASLVKIHSKSIEKRDRYNKKDNKNITKLQKDNNNIQKLSDIAEKFAIKKRKFKSKILENKEKIKNKLFNIIKSNKTIQKDSNDISTKENYNTLPQNNLSNSDIFDSVINKKNYEIFEVISDVKVKSFIEYEEDKKNLLTKKESQNNGIPKINSFKNLNIKEFEDKSNDNKIQNLNSKFIKDRDEYNIKLKETFSKDRFSFRPTNNDSNETFQDTKIQNENKILNKKDFISKKIVSSSSMKNNLVSNKKKNKSIKNNNIVQTKEKKLVKSKSREKTNKK